MRRIGRIRRKKQKKILIIGSLSLLLLLCVGYATFSTNLNISAKGNIKITTISTDDLIKDVVTSGDGLYKDEYEQDRYIYKGSNPDNYIKIDEEMYRILSVENDKSLKIVKDESIGVMAWDTVNNRVTSSNTYCQSSSTLGCNAWAATTNLLGAPNVMTIYFPYNNSNNYTSIYTGTVIKDASINQYLSTNYYNSLSSETKKTIIKKEWNVGSPGHESLDDEDISLDIIQEQSYKWSGYIGLFSATEVMRATTNKSCNSLYVAFNNWNKSVCSENNWLWHKEYNRIWTISAGAQHTGHVWTIDDDGFMNCNDAFYQNNVIPSFYLSSNILLIGKGTLDNPFQIAF